MAQYPGSEQERRFDARALERAVGSLFRACGMRASDAETVAGSLVEADLRGIHSHGVLRVPEYVHKLVDGGVDPRGQPLVATESAGAVTVDGANAMGQVVAKFSMNEAVARARAHGVSVVAARGSNHCGALDRWVMMAAAEDQVGLAMTNALPTMAPWGGLDKIVGMNPLAIAIPGADCGALVMDLAFGESAHGKIRVYAQKGAPIPPGWAYDADGEPTTDAAAAIEGLIAPIGGHKGIALAIMSGALSTVLSGARYGTDLGHMERGPTPGADGHLFMALDIAAFRPVAEVRAAADRIAAEVVTSRRKKGVDALLVPGQLERGLAEARRIDGIPLNEQTVTGICECGSRLGVALGPEFHSGGNAAG